MATDSVNLMLVEDNPADVRLIRHALDECKAVYRLTLARDGEEAIAMLRRRAPHEHVARPDFILLDLNLPRKDGRAVLAEVKEDPELRGIPVVVLSTSTNDQDVRYCYEHHAQSYVAKPVELDRFTEVIGELKQYWMGTAVLPSR